MPQSVRSEIVYRRSYARPFDMENPTRFENWDDIIDRVIYHQAWLWARAKGSGLNDAQFEELADLRSLMQKRAACVSGRTLWLGGTETARTKECSQFNCAYTNAETVHDMVDIFHLLLCGCGVGFRPVPGTLHGFSSLIPKVTVAASVRTAKGGNPNNVETYVDGVWTIRVGDSEEAWAKAFGKLLAGKHIGCRELVLDFTEIRPAGGRLKGFGWICHGYKPLADALQQIAKIMNQRAGELLRFGDIHEIVNLLGTVLSTRRSAQIALCLDSDPWSDSFADFKTDADERPWKYQSNNTILFEKRPSLERILEVLRMMQKAGGSEPGLGNLETAREKCPWVTGFNPCFEICLPNKGFCNLVEINLSYDWKDRAELLKAARLIARANYRQTCVNLRDGILQSAWHENNENLRLCGVGLTSIANSKLPLSNDGIGQYALSVELNWAACQGAASMAEELNLPLPKATTTVKPSGTLSKVMDAWEGFHQPLGRYIFNNINFGPHDPMLPALRQAGYEVSPHPVSQGSWLVKIPVDNGKEPVAESAIQQLNRYRYLMSNWCDHNVSCTIYYDESEIPAIAFWLYENWDFYVGVSFLPRQEVMSKTQAKDLGYPYLPQEVVTKAEYDAYTENLKPVNFGHMGVLHGEETTQECASGACPIN